MTQINTR